MRPENIGVCALLINSRNQVVLGIRKNGYKAGFYGLPGGKVEAHEALLTAIQREVVEETGLATLNFAFIGVIREDQGEYDFIHFVFCAEIGKQQPQLCEPDKCEAWQFFDLNKKLPKILPGHLAGIEMYLQRKIVKDLV